MGEVPVEQWLPLDFRFILKNIFADDQMVFSLYALLIFIIMSLREK